MVCRLVRAPSTWTTLLCTSSRASASCSVMAANERVEAAQLVARGEHRLGRQVALGHLAHALRQQQQRAGELVGQRHRQQQRAEHRQDQRSVSVPMYILRRPSRPSARCWYSR